MKQFGIILLCFLMLLPSIGVHIDVSFCCGNISEIGLAHQIALDLESCCDDRKMKSCMTQDEIIQAPTQLEYLAQTNKDVLPDLATYKQASLPIQNPLDFHVNSWAHKPKKPPSKKLPLAFFQVFLC